MLQMSSSYLLWGLLGLLLPLAIHLWNRKEGEKIQVGSIKWLIEGEKQRFNTLQFSDLLLFLVRSFLIALFSFLLTRPFFTDNSKKEAQLPEKWILTASNNFPLSIQSEIEQLEASGYERRYLQPNFPKTFTEELNTTNIWKSLETLDQEENRPDSILIYATASSRIIQGRKPKVSIPIEWRLLPMEERTQYFLLDSWTIDKTIRVIIGTTTNEQTVFKEVVLDKGQESYQLANYPKLIVEEKGASKVLYFENTPQQQLTITKKEALAISIVYDQGYQRDAQILKIALEAIRRFTGRSILIKNQPIKTFVNKEESFFNKIFWLSKKEIPINLTAEQTIQYEPNKAAVDDFEYVDNQLVVLRKELGSEKVNFQNNQLFLQELLTVLFKGELIDYQKNIAQNDSRSIAEQQFLPLKKSSEKTITLSEITSKQFLHFPLWLGLMGLFVLERFMSSKTSN